jgi:hypothetical protein
MSIDIQIEDWHTLPDYDEAYRLSWAGGNAVYVGQQIGISFDDEGELDASDLAGKCRTFLSVNQPIIGRPTVVEKGPRGPLLVNVGLPADEIVERVCNLLTIAEEAMRRGKKVVYG